MPAVRQGGFTLIEVLVAFTILVASVSVAVVIFGNGLRLAGIADDYARAITVAESRMAELRAAQTLLPGESGGAVAEDMVWNVRIVPGFVGEAAAEAKPDYFRIAVTVLWGGEDAPRSFTLHSLLAPPQADQGQDEGEAADEGADGEEAGADEQSDGGGDGSDAIDEE